MAALEYKEALKEIDKLVFAKAGRRLNHLEKIVLEAAWENKEYSEIASDYSVEHLRSNIGRNLWLLLTGVLGDGERVTKRRVRQMLEQKISTIASHDLSIFSRSNQLKDFETSPQILGEKLPDISSFYGRTDELSELRKSISINRCVAIHGVSGIGKSALVAKLIESVNTGCQPKIDFCIWKSAYYGLTVETLATDLIELLTPSSELEGLPTYTEAKVSLLLRNLQARRCLLVLDGAEVFLRESDDNDFKYHGGYEEFRIFIKRIAEEQHQCCMILTSRKPFECIDVLHHLNRPTSSLEIKGLALEDAKQILRAKDLTCEEEWESLIKYHRSNPSELQIITSKIKDVFDGRVEEFLKFKTSLAINLFQGKLDQQFKGTESLSALEKQIVFYLADKLLTKSEPLPRSQLINDVKAQMKPSVSSAYLMEALDNLVKLSLIKKSENKKTGETVFDLEPMIKDYVTKDPSRLFGASHSTITAT